LKARSPVAPREAVDVTIYGRTEELHLEKWILKERCRLVALLGMGIGKPLCQNKLRKSLSTSGDRCNAPPLGDILASLIQLSSNSQVPETDLPESVGGLVSQLIEYLRSHRCLIILDNVEIIMQSGAHAGRYLGYENYGH